MRFLVSSFLAVALLACGSKPKATTLPPSPPGPTVVDSPPTPPGPAATPTDAELEPMFVATLTFLDEMAVAITSNAGNCKQIATAIDQVFAAHHDLLTQAKSFKGNAEVDAKADAFMEKNQARVSAAAEKMSGGMQACADDPDVNAVMKRFDEM